MSIERAVRTSKSSLFFIGAISVIYASTISLGTRILDVLFERMKINENLLGHVTQIMNLRSFPLKGLVVYLLGTLIYFLLLIPFALLASLLFYLLLRKMEPSLHPKGIAITPDSLTGAVVGGFIAKPILISEDIWEDEELRTFVILHEKHHQESKGLELVVMVFLLIMSSFNGLRAVLHAFWSDPLRASALPIHIAMPLATLPLLYLTIRVEEVHADLNAYRHMGRNAYQAFIRMKTMKENSRGPLTRLQATISGFLHTGRRDIVLKEGDAIAPHNPIELSLIQALLSAAFLWSHILFTAFGNRLGGMEPSGVLFISLAPYLLLIMLNIAVPILLSLGSKPILRKILPITGRGVLNLGTLIASMYLLLESASLLFLPDTPQISMVLPFIGFFACLLISKHYVGNFRAALMSTSLVIIEVIAVSTAVLIILGSVIGF